jgi:phosphoserine phosphatase RsbX
MSMQIAPIQVQQSQTSVVEWAVGKRAKDVEQLSSLTAVVKSTPSGFLIAVIDATQDGKPGNFAAQAAAEIFEGYTHHSLVDLFNRADRCAKETGGCSISAAIFNTSYHTATWFGVGNVQGFLHHRSPSANPRYQWLKLQQGFVGDNRFQIRESTHPVRFGDVLILATSGIRSEFSGALPIEGKPRVVADSLLASFAREDDDALMLVTRYLGGSM